VKKLKAFTLLEIIISMGIILIAMGALFMAFSVALRMFVDESNRTDVFIEADRGISGMTKELISAREIISSGSREITFWAEDYNDDGTREASEVVAFTWSGSSESALYRQAGGVSVPIAYGVRNMAFTYDDPSSPTFVKIYLLVTKLGIFSTIESSVKLRNI